LAFWLLGGIYTKCNIIKEIETLMYDMLYTFKGSSAKHTASISDYNSTEGYASPKCQNLWARSKY